LIIVFNLNILLSFVVNLDCFSSAVLPSETNCSQRFEGNASSLFVALGRNALVIGSVRNLLQHFDLLMYCGVVYTFNNNVLMCSVNI